MPETISTVAREGPEPGAEIESGQRTAVTVLGLGLMGAALAGTFVSHGHPTTVWNRSTGKADGLVARGARPARTVAEAVAASPLVVVCVSTYDVVTELLDPLGDVLAGRTLVNLTTGTPRQAREMAARAAERGVDYLDGAIMAIPPMIGQPDTLLLHSGNAAAFEAHRSTLTLLGGGTTYVGADAGLAPLYDMALLSMMYALYGGFFHAIALVGTAAVDGATFMPYADRILKEVVSWLPDTAREIDAGDYATDVSTLDINKDGVAHIVHASEELGIRADVLRPIQALIERRVAEGHGRDGLASLIEVLRRPIEEE
jgi:3-hydroxyisobutyrate dehydrogenase-like beta-hydroxyacid dehydrogenase